MTTSIGSINDGEYNLRGVGRQARFLCRCHRGALYRPPPFNQAGLEGLLKAPVVMAGTIMMCKARSPTAETSDIRDGSNLHRYGSAQCHWGCFRGATGFHSQRGGVGGVNLINGGFGMVLDGKYLAEQTTSQMLFW
jgi:urocanate hydratase